MLSFTISIVPGRISISSPALRYHYITAVLVYKKPESPQFRQTAKDNEINTFYLNCLKRNIKRNTVIRNFSDIQLFDVKQQRITFLILNYLYQLMQSFLLLKKKLDLICKFEDFYMKKLVF